MAGSLGTFVGTQPTWKREGPLYQVKVDTAESGAEVRTVFGTSPRYRYTTDIVLSSSTEISGLMTLLNNNYLSGGSFTITDPVAGGTVTVRMEAAPVLAQYRGISGWWSTSLVMVSVL